MTFHTQVVGANGQRQAMAIERVEGLAATILANFRLRPTDALMVFSAGGTTAVPIEMAMGARSRGLPVIAVTSVEHSRAAAVAALVGHAPARPRRRRARPVHAAGDALVEVGDERVGPGLVGRRGRARERGQGADGRAARRAGRAAAGAGGARRSSAPTSRAPVRRRLRRARASLRRGAPAPELTGAASAGRRRARVEPEREELGREELVRRPSSPRRRRPPSSRVPSGGRRGCAWRAAASAGRRSARIVASSPSPPPRRRRRSRRATG